MRLAVVQTDPIFGQIQKNVGRATEVMAEVQADLYVLPELFNSGYNFTSLDEVEQLSETPSGFTFQQISKFTKQGNTFVAYGFAERANDRFYNSSALVGPGGLIGIYRKVHLYFRETLFFHPGDQGFPVFDLPFGRVGMMICFDWFYPESARALALAGAQLIAHPSNLVMPHCPDAMVTRCLENHIFAATANRIGVEDCGVRLACVDMSSAYRLPVCDCQRRLSRARPSVWILGSDGARICMP